MKKNIGIFTDFDGTLGKENIEDILFNYYFKNLKKAYPWMEKPEDYWKRVEFWRYNPNKMEEIKKGEFDKIEKSHDNSIHAKALGYMQAILDDMNAGIFPPINNEMLRILGQQAYLFKGLPEFFNNLKSEFKGHANLIYVIDTQALEEMVIGSPVAPYVDSIHGSKYSEERINGKSKIKWISTPIEHDMKISPAVKVSKGVDDIFLNVNNKVIEYRNMLFLGDSEGDIPVMEFFKSHKGYGIIICDPDDPAKKERTLKRLGHWTDKIYDADYSVGSELYNEIAGRVEKMIYRNPVTRFFMDMYKLGPRSNSKKEKTIS